MKILFIYFLIISFCESISKFELDASKIKSDNIIQIEFQYYDSNYPNLFSQIDCKFEKEKYCLEGIEMHSFELYIKAKNEKLVPIKRDSASLANINLLCPEIIGQSVYNIFENNINTIVRNFSFKKLNSCIIMDKDNLDPFTKIHAIIFNVDGNEENHTPAYDIDNNERDFKQINSLSLAKKLEFHVNKKLQRLYREKLEEINYNNKNSNQSNHQLIQTVDTVDLNKINILNDENLKDKNLDFGNENQKNEMNKNVVLKEINEEWSYLMDGMVIILFTLLF